tara:strand:- start:923 stop:1126 length:204 start_codon:yes stop_codon:yes gene_type:complete
MAYPDKTDWKSKEQRELFAKVVNCYIMKSGSDKDPVIDKILPIAKQVVDEAFKVYPDKNDKEEEKPI